VTNGAYDYGGGGLFGLATPQANPTVEAEFRLLAPEDALYCIARLVSSESDPQRRLADYLGGFEATLAQFDTLRFSAIGFACTGSSYLAGADTETKRVEALSRIADAPIVTAAMAIGEALEAAGARRIALIAPYPQPLIEAATTYWRTRGFDVVKAARIITAIADTRSIYALSSADAANALEAIGDDADAVVISGTGMPSLRALQGAKTRNVLSSNLCLAWAMARHGPRPMEFAAPHDLLAAAKARILAALQRSKL
jgi:maleate isomerase